MVVVCVVWVMVMGGNDGDDGCGVCSIGDGDRLVMIKGGGDGWQ